MSLIKGTNLLFIRLSQFGLKLGNLGVNSIDGFGQGVEVRFLQYMSTQNLEEVSYLLTSVTLLLVVAALPGLDVVCP